MIYWSERAHALDECGKLVEIDRDYPTDGVIENIKALGCLVRSQAQVISELSGELEDLKRNVNAIPINPGPWIDLAPGNDWVSLYGAAKCRRMGGRIGGWIELRGAIGNQWKFARTTTTWLMLPPECRPITERVSKVPCYKQTSVPGHDGLTDVHSPDGSSVCNIHFGPDGQVTLHSSVPVAQLRFDGVRIWGGD
jgi:hypothetical protein